MTFAARFSELVLPLEATRAYAENVSDWSAPPAGVLRPTQTGQIREIVRAANEFRVKLHPLSGGTNWGFGSRLAPEPGTWIVDLSRLKEIRLEAHGAATATIEPGVTQGDLHRYLRANDSPYVFNVTGSGLETSIVGNALERGIGYFAQRDQDVLGLEAVRGDGQSVHMPDPAYATLGYAPGLGPDGRGLCTQATLAIVTHLTLRLIRRSPVMGGILITVPTRMQLEPCLELLTHVLQEGWLASVPHLANSVRLQQSLGLAQPPAWMALLPLQGIPGQAEIVLEELRRRLPDGATAAWTPADDQNGMPGLAQWLQGHPTNEGLRVIQGHEITSPEQIDRLPAGVRYLNALLPLRGDAVTRLERVLHEVAHQLEIPPLGITLNALSPRTLAAIISLPHQRSPEGITQANRHYEIINQACRTHGWLPYRLTHGTQAWARTQTHTTKGWHQELKNVWDPNGILV